MCLYTVGAVHKCVSAVYLHIVCAVHRCEYSVCFVYFVDSACVIAVCVCILCVVHV